MDLKVFIIIIMAKLIFITKFKLYSLVALISRLSKGLILLRVYILDAIFFPPDFQSLEMFFLVGRH